MTHTEIGVFYRIGASEPETVIPNDGSKFTRDELRRFVGGDIQLIPFAAGDPVGYRNEEGRRHHLPLNELASSRFAQVLVGDVIEVRRKELEDEDVLQCTAGHRFAKGRQPAKGAA